MILSQNDCFLSHYSIYSDLINFSKPSKQVVFICCVCTLFQLRQWFQEHPKCKSSPWQWAKRQNFIVGLADDRHLEWNGAVMESKCSILMEHSAPPTEDWAHGIDLTHHSFLLRQGSIPWWRSPCGVSGRWPGFEGEVSETEGPGDLPVSGQ